MSEGRVSGGPVTRYSRNSRISRMSNVGTRKEKAGESRKIVDEETGADITPLDLLQVPDGTEMPAEEAPSGAESPSSRRSSMSGESRGSIAARGARGPQSIMMGLDDAELSAPHTPEVEEIHSRRPSTVEGTERLDDLLTESELDALVPVTLTETGTHVLLDMPARVVHTEGPEADAVRRRNESYEALLEAKRGSDRFVHAEAQTLNALRRSQHCQPQRMSFADAGSQAFSYEIADEMWGQAREDDSSGNEDSPHLKLVSHTRELPDDEQPAAAGMIGSAPNGVSQMGSMAGSTAGLGSVFGSTMSLLGSKAAGLQKKGSQLAKLFKLEIETPERSLATLPRIAEALQLVESAVAQGPYADRLLLFRGVRQSALRGAGRNLALTTGTVYGDVQPLAPAAPGSSAIDEGSRSRRMSRASNLSQGSLARTVTDMSDAPGTRHSPVSMDHLWDYSCSLFEGKNVSCVSWNKARPDLLAVGYGTFEFTFKAGKYTARPHDQDESASQGFVAFWSLKSPEWPLFWVRTHSGVTSIDWSGRYPSILAVGLYDGSISIYDVRDKDATPVMQADHDTGQHTDPVWKVKWVDFGDRGESLVSISTDSRVIRWSTAKGLERTLLMTLKKQVDPSKQQSTGKEPEAFISRNASGMCFDFNARDESIYVTSTEEGTIHKCSTSYSDQYLESYWGHMGPVYKVQYSPFQPGLFVSASADWTLKLWREGKQEPLLTLHSSADSVGHAVNDVAWCPYNATVLASVSQDGAVELWDLEYSVLGPEQKVQPFPGIAMTCVAFSEASTVLACGAASGKVHLFRLSGLAMHSSRAAQDEARRLDEVMTKNVMKVRARKGQLDGVVQKQG